MSAADLDPELWEQICMMDIEQRLKVARVFRRWADQLDEFNKSDVWHPQPEHRRRN